MVQKVGGMKDIVLTQEKKLNKLTNIVNNLKSSCQLSGEELILVLCEAMIKRASFGPTDVLQKLVQIWNKNAPSKQTTVNKVI